ncbi:MAG: YggS family pyridoxal phosphate-dependent enzyme [Pseudomonadota bacterium]
MRDLCARLDQVQRRVTQALSDAGRMAEQARILAVSKTVSADTLRTAYACGQRAFGESYVQEALPKLEALSGLELEWHFIGPIQGNKTRLIAEHFAWVHSIDRLRVAERLNAQRPADLPPLNVCIQVNIDREASKSGVQIEDAPALAHAVARLPRLRLRGLMAIPQPSDDPQRQSASFARLRQLKETLVAQGLELDTLSMGMSADLEAAVAQGATWVRVGTAIFGDRPAQV